MDTVSHLAMEEASANRPPYDNSEAKERESDGHRAHFFFGDEAPHYETNYTRHFGPKPPSRPPQADLSLQKSSIGFDADAGLGPNTLRLRQREQYPSVPDAHPPDVRSTNFDTGYDPTTYVSTAQDALQNGRTGALRTQPSGAPVCAEFATHGDAAPKWQTTHETDFQDRPPVPNSINESDLRETHFELGFDRTEYDRPPMAVAHGIPHQETIDLQTSNPVFRGDQQMRFQTTSSDLVGVYDKSADGRGRQVDNSSQRLFIGGDRLDYSTTARDANRMAGRGRPASRSVDLHLIKSGGFARGGRWDTFAVAKTDVDQNVPMGYPKRQRLDPSYFKQTHFNIDATESDAATYETTYFEEICRPKIVESGK
jgi:hypothetical protein